MSHPLNKKTEMSWVVQKQKPQVVRLNPLGALVVTLDSRMKPPDSRVRTYDESQQRDFA